MKCILLVVIVLIPATLCGPLLPLKCDTGDESAADIPVNLIVPLCEAPPCILRKGQTIDVEVDFDVRKCSPNPMGIGMPFVSNDARNTNNLTVKVTGIIDGFELPWNGVKTNGCDDIIVGWCPMRAGDYWTYGVAIKVEAIYPSTPLIIKWQMRDDSGKAIWCFHLPAEIVS